MAPSCQLSTQSPWLWRADGIGKAVVMDWIWILFLGRNTLHQHYNTIRSSRSGSRSANVTFRRLKGVHLRRPSLVEYFLLQHRFLH